METEATLRTPYTGPGWAYNRLQWIADSMLERNGDLSTQDVYDIAKEMKLLLTQFEYIPGVSK